MQRLFWWSVAGIAAALIALNYHFIGDGPAGAFIGEAVGGAASWFGLQTSLVTGPVNYPSVRIWGKKSVRQRFDR